MKGIRLLVLSIGLVIVVFLGVADTLNNSADKYLISSLNNRGAASISYFKIGDTNGHFVQVDSFTTKTLFDVFKESKEPTNCYLGIGSTYSIKLGTDNGHTFNNLEFVYNAKSKTLAIGLPPKWYGLMGNEATYFGRDITNTAFIDQALDNMVHRLNIHNFR